MKSCQWCMETFESDLDYQVYCSKECRELATKAKVRERTRIATIRKRYQKKRYCANGCGTRLNAYNDSKICLKCSIDQKLVNKAIDDIKEFFDFEENL